PRTGYLSLDGARRRTLLLLPTCRDSPRVDGPPGLAGNRVPRLWSLPGGATVLAYRPLQEGETAGSVSTPGLVARGVPGPRPAAGDPVRGLGGSRGVAEWHLNPSRIRFRAGR